MLYMQAADGSVKIIVLESANLEELKKGRPIKSPDGTVCIAWTPDPVWLADKIMDTDGDSIAIAKLIDEASKRPEKTNRPSHKPHTHRFPDVPEE